MEPELIAEISRTILFDFVESSTPTHSPQQRETKEYRSPTDPLFGTYTAERKHQSLEESAYQQAETMKDFFRRKEKEDKTREAPSRG